MDKSARWWVRIWHASSAKEAAKGCYLGVRFGGGGGKKRESKNEWGEKERGEEKGGKRGGSPVFRGEG